MQNDARMQRKQYHLSTAQLERIEALRIQLGLNSSAELIRRAIDAFDPQALDTEESAMVQATANALLGRIRVLNTALADTLERAAELRRRLSDPDWIERIRARTRREAADDPALVEGMARLVGTRG